MDYNGTKNKLPPPDLLSTPHHWASAWRSFKIPGILDSADYYPTLKRQTARLLPSETSFISSLSVHWGVQSCFPSKTVFRRWPPQQSLLHRKATPSIDVSLVPSTSPSPTFNLFLCPPPRMTLTWSKSRHSGPRRSTKPSRLEAGMMG